MTTTLISGPTNKACSWEILVQQLRGCVLEVDCLDSNLCSMLSSCATLGKLPLSMPQFSHLQMVTGLVLIELL